MTASNAASTQDAPSGTLAPSGTTAVAARPPPTGARPEPGAAESDAVTALASRIGRLERQVRVSRLLVILLLVAGSLFYLSTTLGEGLVVKRTLMESRELKLIDNDGTARLFLRMYSRVPVMQVMDATGTPRISLGLRFDDSPFLVLSDTDGRKRFSLEMDPNGDAALRLVGPDGRVKSSLQ